MQRVRCLSESYDEAESPKKAKPDPDDIGEIAKAYTVKDEGTYTVILVVEGVKLYVIGEVNTEI